MGNDEDPEQLVQLADDLKRQGWVPVSWAADRHGSTEYIVAREVPGGHVIVGLSLATVDQDVYYSCDAWRESGNRSRHVALSQGTLVDHPSVAALKQLIQSSISDWQSMLALDDRQAAEGIYTSGYQAGHSVEPWSARHRDDDLQTLVPSHAGPESVENQALMIMRSSDTPDEVRNSVAVLGHKAIRDTVVVQLEELGE